MKIRKCGSKEKNRKVVTPVAVEKDVCTMAPSSEHARFDSPDTPCDDAHGTGA